MEIFCLLNASKAMYLNTKGGPQWDTYEFNDARSEVIVKSASANDPEINVFSFSPEDYAIIKFLLLTYLPNTSTGMNAGEIYNDRERILDASRRLTLLARTEGEVGLRNRELQAEAEALSIPDKEASLEAMKRRAKNSVFGDFDVDPTRRN